MRASLTFFLLACAAGLVAAQAPADNPAQRPTFRGGTNYVRVDMYATRDGVPITDLRPEDIEVREDGTPQAIKDFEHVQVRTRTPQDLRAEPNTIAESRAMAADARARVFVLFLDTYHITPEGLASIRQPLVKFIERLMGPDDLIAVMTPEMGASDISFARRTVIIDGILQRSWAWSRRERIEINDDKDQLYKQCYKEEFAQMMIERRREKLSLDALSDLVTYLDGVRDERKAVITISDGWRLFKPSRELGEMRIGQPAETIPPPIAGTRRRADGSRDQESPKSECELDRNLLARIDNEAREDEITRRANRSNVTFYPVTPRGMVAFDESIGSTTKTPLEDAAALRDRVRSLRNLALDTDGISVVDTNFIDAYLKRIADDLSSYYLLGYESTNSKLDGRFRSIAVKVNRPGVQVRARKGYLSLRPEEVRTSSSTAAPAAPSLGVAREAAPPAVVVNPRASFRLRPVVWAAGAAPSVWITGELDTSARRDPAWASGGSVELTVSSASGARVATLQAAVTPAEPGFTVQVPADLTLAPGNYSIRARVTPKAGQSLPLSDLQRVTVPETPAALGQAMLWRRGPSTGTRYVTTADPRFQRSERVRLELATRNDGPATARVIDKTGKPLPIEVAVSERRDAGTRWIVADTPLAALAAGDYAIEVTLGAATQATSFRVIP